MILQLVRYMQADRRSRVPYLSRRMAVDERLLMATDAGFRYVVLTGRVRDKAQADRLLRQYQVSSYGKLAVLLHRKRQIYERNYLQRLVRLVQRWFGLEQVDPERREWEVFLRDGRVGTGHFRQVKVKNE